MPVALTGEDGNVLSSSGLDSAWSLTVDQTRPLPAGQHFQIIGTAELVADVETTIQIRNADTTGIVVLDAVQLEAVE